MKGLKSNYSKFLLLWAGELISAIGGGLSSFGLGVYVFNTTGSAGSMALVTLLAFLPTILFSIPAGVLADRFDRRLLMMIGDGCSALGLVYILICMAMGEALLWQIGLGVFVSSTFSALLEPAYRATITDLLTKEEFSRASGMVSLAGSARYLVSPILAGALLAITDIRVLLFIDIFTFFPTVIAAAVVRKEISVNRENKEPFGKSLREGWRACTDNRGILILLVISAILTCFMGTFQILAEPMILSFANSTTLGIGETVCACGMLVSSLYLGVRGIKHAFVRAVSLSLAFAGVCMAGFGLWGNIYSMCVFGFLFFAALPVANNALDYLVRTNIADELQGRAWGVIGFLSQLGYVVAYSVAGVSADAVAAHMHISVGRGAAWIVVGAGILLGVTALCMYPLRSLRALEKEPSCAQS